MRIQFIIVVALGSLLQCAANETESGSGAYILVRRRGIFEWLNWILFPPMSTTAATTVATTAATAAATASPTSVVTSPVHVSTSTTESPWSESEDRDCSSCRCGLINTRRKIIGGQETRRHQYPWMAVILFLGRFYCAGSLINDLYVLTAAHCVEGVPPDIITVRLMEHNRSASDAQVVQRNATSVKIHALYNPRNFDNDIALIKLHRPVQLSGDVRPICLPAYFTSFDGERAIVTGWGAKREGDYATDTLQEVDVLVLSQSACRNSSYSAALITENMLCAGYLQEGAKDACRGDSGGPLHITFDEQPGQYQLAGIVSWGEGCARPNLPGVYTRVNQYLRWIEDNTPAVCTCTPYAVPEY